MSPYLFGSNDKFYSNGTATYIFRKLIYPARRTKYETQTNIFVEKISDHCAIQQTWA